MDAIQFHSRPETDGELLDVVDEADCVVGRETRRRIHEQGLMHRAVHVVLIDSASGRFLLCRRSEAKDTHPGLWDISVGGHVASGEGYEETAVREIREEAGVGNARPRLVATVPPSPRNGWEHIRLYEADVDPSQVRVHAGEISSSRWVDPGQYLLKASTSGAEPDWRMAPPAHDSIMLWIRARGAAS